MFLLFRAVQHFAAGLSPRLLALAGALMTAAGLALAGAGLASHQPIVTRFGILVLLATIVSLFTVRRARR